MLVGTWKWRAAEIGVGQDDLEGAVGWGYEGYGAKARDESNGPRDVEMWHYGENF